MGFIYLIRHGQTRWNKEEIFRGQYDIPLDDFGRKQALAVAEELKTRKLEKPIFLSSPLQRASETAILASSFLDEKEDKFSNYKKTSSTTGAQIYTENAFNDINFGEWQGKSRALVESSYPELYQKWIVEPDSVSFPGGGNLRETSIKALEAFYTAAKKYAEYDLVIVSHRVITKALLCMLLGCSLNVFRRIQQNTACINLLEWDGASFNFLLLNDTCHLRYLQEKNNYDL